MNTNTKTKDVMEFAAVLQAELPKNPPHLTARDAMALMRLGRQHSTQAANLCNIPNYQEKYDKRTANIRVKIVDILFPYGAHALCGGDPRGCIVKLILRSGRTNDFDGEAYCVPGA